MGAHHNRSDGERERLPYDLPPIPEYVEDEYVEDDYSKDEYAKDEYVKDSVGVSTVAASVDNELPPIPEYVEPESADDVIEEEEKEVPPIPDYLTPEEEEAADAREEASESRRTWLRSVLEFVGLLAIALVVSVVIKTFFIQAFVVPSGSMETTLKPGDRIFVNRLADSPDDIERGDIIVFSDPNNWLSAPADDGESTGLGSFISRTMETVGLLPADSGQHLVKRVIGVGGDTVECCDVQGRMSVNGVALDETYLDPGIAPSDFDFSVTVPNGQLWVMGDNRGNSNDSRQHHEMDGNGFVPNSHVVGRVWSVFWPYEEMHVIESGRDVFKNVPDAK
ncbi:MAG: signal peptidase I [Actinomycetaceae bacterium]|nr:signal peptidase I [Actinomycetaceae bacterium]